MRVFLDTSALAKRYIQEPGSEELGALLTTVSTEIIVSTLAFVEFASAMGRKLRDKEVPEAAVGDAIKELKQDWRHVVTKIPLEEALAQEAAAVALEYSLKGADAVHMASAHVLEADLFVASDNRLIRVAKEMGMEFYNPETGSYIKRHSKG